MLLALVVASCPAAAFAQSLGSPSSVDPPPFTAEMPPPPPSARKNADPDDHGLAIGLRVGYGRAFGNTSEESGGLDLGSALDGALPVRLTAGYRAVPWVQLSFAGWLAPLFLSGSPTSCDPSAGRRCSGWGGGIAFEVQVHTRPAALLDPWIGLGFGYEWLHVDTEDPNAGPGMTRSGSSQFGGTYYLDAALGLDVRIAHGLSVGPFVGLQVGRYSSVVATDDNGVQTAYQFKQPAFHEWLTAGIHTRFTF